MSSATLSSVTWNFQNAIFDDGTALTGSFDFDMGGSFWSQDAYSNVSLTTQDGVIGGEHYDAAAAQLANTRTLDHFKETLGS